VALNIISLKILLQDCNDGLLFQSTFPVHQYSTETDIAAFSFPDTYLLHYDLTAGIAFGF
jgi:hypothetical protein